MSDGGGASRRLRRRPPTLLLLAGLPASGKSHLARALAARVPLVVASSDAIRLELTKGRADYSPAETAAMIAASGALVAGALDAGEDVAIDATLLTARARASALAPARERGLARILVWCAVSEAEADRRLAHRAAGADPEDRSEADGAVRASMAARAEWPGADEADLVLVADERNADAILARLVTELARDAYAAA